MIFRAGCLPLWIGCALLVACDADPGRSVLLEGSRPRQRGPLAVNSVEIQSPYPLPIEGPRTVILELATREKRPVNFRIKGALPANLRVNPREWNSFRVELPEGPAVLRFSGAGALLGNLYVEPSAPSPRPNVLLLSVDTLRYDAFTPSLMPGTRKILEQGVIFEGMQSVTSWTLPAHASLLSGQYPARHGARERENRVPGELSTLAKVLQAHGYYTLGITEGAYLSWEFGHAPGFHRYYEQSVPLVDSEWKEGKNVSQLASNLKFLKASLAKRGNEPIFVLFHTYEVHAPYLARMGTSDPDGIGRTGWILEHTSETLEPEMYARLRELYDGEVRYTDQVLAPLLTSLHESGNWLIVLVSDHGEEFGEHGSLNHAHSLHEELTHIPFAMAGPGLPTGRTIPSLASIVDVAPTLLGALEIPIPSEWQGRNLLAGDEERGPVFAENFFKSEKHESIMPDFRQLAIWRDGMKLIKNRAMGESTEELYDLELDPGETTASAVEDAEWSATLSQMIADYLALEGADAEEVEDLSESDRRSLEALGYVE